MSTFTGVVVKFLLADAETEQTCRLWLRVVEERVRANGTDAAAEHTKVEIEFAHQLYEDFRATYATGRGCGDLILDGFLDIGFAHVNFRRVARYLLRRFNPTDGVRLARHLALEPSAN